MDPLYSPHGRYTERIQHLGVDNVYDMFDAHTVNSSKLKDLNMSEEEINRSNLIPMSHLLTHSPLPRFEAMVDAGIEVVCALDGGRESDDPEDDELSMFLRVVGSTGCTLI